MNRASMGDSRLRCQLMVACNIRGNDLASSAPWETRHADQPFFARHPPEDMAQMVKAKVESGEYASESEVIGEGLRALRDRDDALNRWLKEEVVAAYEEYQINPSDVADGRTVAERRVKKGIQWARR